VDGEPPYVHDAAADYVVLARLLSARGQSDAARRELGTAIRLEPDNPRPHVELGIIAARAARYDEAVQHFKAAKALAPAYPNLDRLIDEASKRR
jgi:Flp pilus assembly protein TadD